MIMIQTASIMHLMSQKSDSQAATLEKLRA